jgi:hypothetical protein
MRPLRHVALQVLALHTRRHASSLRPWQDLAGELGVTPLRLVLVALEIEGIYEVDLDLTGLDRQRTVGDLLTFLERRVHEARVIDDVA